MTTKKLVLVCSMAIAFLIPMIVLAQDAAPTPSDASGPQVEQALTPEERAEVLRVARQLLAMVGEQGSTAAATQSQTTQGQQAAASGKTTADVADRALDVFEKYGDKVVGLVASAAGTLEKAAPKIWRVMVVKQYATAISDLVVPWGLFILTIVYIAVIRKRWQLDHKPDYDRSGADFVHLLLTAIVPSVVCIATAWWGFVRIADTIKLLIVPEYYAFRDLLSMILKQQAL